MSDRRRRRGLPWASAAGALAAVALSCSSGSSGPTSCTAGSFQLANGGAVSAPDPGTTCLTPVGDTSLPSEVAYRGRHAVGDTVTFQVPSGTRTVSILSQAVSAVSAVNLPGGADGGVQAIGNTVVPTQVTLPGGQVIFDDTSQAYFPADPSSLPVYYGGSSVLTGAMTIPNTTPTLATAQASGLAAGTWTFVVNDWAYECYYSPASVCTGGTTADVYDVTVLAKPGRAAAVGTLDLSVYLVTPAALGGSGLTAQQAVSNLDVYRAISQLAGLLAKGGVCVGKVTFHDVPSWALTRYASLNVDQTDPCSDLAQMFTLSQPDGTLAVFLVDEITSTPPAGTTYQVVGQDGTIPGPASVGGTVASGVVVSAADLGAGTCAAGPSVMNCGDDLVGYVSAHEAGHYLGLYHDTEGTGDYFDPIADTPMCPCTSCAPAADQSSCAATNPAAASPYLMQSADCSVSTSCGGADDLMFWLLSSGVQGNLTAQQGGVMRANPIVR